MRPVEVTDIGVFALDLPSGTSLDTMPGFFGEVPSSPSGRYVPLKVGDYRSPVAFPLPQDKDMAAFMKLWGITDPAELHLLSNTGLEAHYALKPAEVVVPAEIRRSPLVWVSELFRGQQDNGDVKEEIQPVKYIVYGISP
tara:strand:- start:308 stop:727 length:420 start_codon:yes stop_codon:yes gene_type:complete